MDVSVAPPEWPIHSQATSVLPSPPIVSSSRARVDREPEITAAKTKVTHDGSDSGIDSDSSNANSDSDLDSANSDSDLDGANSDSDLDGANSDGDLNAANLDGDLDCNLDTANDQGI